MLFFLLFCLFCPFSIAIFESNQILAIPNLEKYIFVLNKTDNFEGVSVDCANDVKKWRKSLTDIGHELMACGKSRNISSQNCDILHQKVFHENVYSIYQFDSFGKIPSNVLNFNKIWMGDYDECLEVKNPQDPLYKTQYCWAHWNIPMTSLIEEEDTSLKMEKNRQSCGKNHATDFKTSICMPRTCSENDLKKVINQNPKAFGKLQKHSESVCEVTCRPLTYPKDGLFWLMTFFLVTISLLAIISTIVDYYGGTSILLAFSMLSNGRSLLKTSKNPNNLKGVECIRFLSFTWVVAGHVWSFWQYSDNPLKTLDIFKTREYELWINAYVSVDTFFLLSGLMLSYSFLPKLTIRKAAAPLTWMVFYLHRFLRLTPAYGFFILFYITYGPLTDRGPNDLVRTVDMDNCRYYGWKNILYINNLYEPRKNCLTVSWYLASDTQMHFVSPIFLIAFLFGPLIGVSMSIITIGVSIGITYYLYFKYDLPATLAQAYATGNPAIMHEYQDFVYDASYTRIPSFLFGLCVGYFLWKTRDRKLRINIGISLFLWALSTFLALYSIFSLHSYNSGEKWTILQRSSYNIFSRILWCISISWLIIALNRGQSGLIGKFMSFKFWTPLGKLSFCGYLCHIMIVGAIFNLDYNPPHFIGATHTYISKVIPSIVLSLFFALFWTLLFEMPFAKLEAKLLSRLVGGGNRNDKSIKSECTKI